MATPNPQSAICGADPAAGANPSRTTGARARAALGLLVVCANFAIGTASAETATEAAQEAYAKQHFAIALAEYRRAAEAGERSAQEIVGLMYLYGPRLYGTAVDRDVAAAKLWLCRAAAQQSEVARYVVARLDEREPTQARGCTSEARSAAAR